jgi:hypothetical protein
MEERRAIVRKRTFKGGSISFEIASGIECTVRNISAAGASLDVSGDIPVPEEFDLIIKPEGIKRSCHVIWRSGSRVGVSFT